MSGEAAGPAALASLLRVYSVEVTAHDTRSIDTVIDHARPETEVFIANLPNEKSRMVVEAARKLSRSGLVPVPHIVARNTASTGELEQLLAALRTEADVNRALILGGDRENSAGNLQSALDIIETGLLQKHGITAVALACYAESHPRIPEDVLWQALHDKLRAAKQAGLQTLLVSQFLFDPQPLIRFARLLREKGVDAPLRVGIAGPAERTKLIRYALRCGVGASLRVLRSRGDLARNVLAGETPDDLLGTIAEANAADPSLGITGAHFFTFGDPASSIQWAARHRSDTPEPLSRNAMWDTPSQDQGGNP